MRLNVVPDTNVLLDLYVYQDPRTLPLTSAIESGHLEFVSCAQAITELRDVLARDKFSLTSDRQRAILADWTGRSRLMADVEIQPAPWRCKDKADQVFLDMAFTCRPCVLLSKDLQVLKFAKRAFKQDVQIAPAWSAELMESVTTL